MRTQSILILACLGLAACGGGNKIHDEVSTTDEPAVPEGLVLVFSMGVFNYDEEDPGPLYAGCAGHAPLEIAASGTNPVISADGRLVAVTQGASVSVLDPARGTSRTVAAASTDPGYARPLAFSPDSTRLVVVTDLGLGVVELATGMLWPVAGATDASTTIARWSSDSKSFLFQDGQPEPDAPTYRVATAIRGPDLMWSTSTLLAGTELLDARDGLLVVQDATNPTNTTVRRADGGDPMGPPLGDILSALIAPGGERLLLRGFTPWSVQTLDGKVLGYLQNADFAAWTDQGLVVAVYGEALGLIDLDSGQRRLIPFFPPVSADGRQLYFEGGFDHAQTSVCPAWSTAPSPG